VPGIGDALRSHEIVGFDSSVFIYYIESVAPYAQPADDALQELAAGRRRGITSVVSLMEVTVRPLRLGLLDAAADYKSLIEHYPNLTVVPVDAAMAMRAAQLRAEHRLLPADALQIAACLEHGATAFVTNDHRLRRIRELDVLVLGDFLP
jgi:predicted nucleic acid-binding protein